MKKHIKKIVACGLLGISLSFGAIHVANADTGVMQRLENLVTRMEKASKTMPTHFNKSTLVDIQDVKIVESEYGGKRILGTVINNTGVDLSQVWIGYTVYDKDENVIREQTGTVIKNIKQGKKAKLSHLLPDGNSAKIELKKVQITVDNIN